jgi:EpsD family peptidyl-prolyl cis-trans isomerase
MEMALQRLLRTLACRSRIRAAALAFVATAFAGLSNLAEAQSDDGRVIAHSGSFQVTQQELDNELRLANIQADQRADQALKAALTHVVARKYLAQRALAIKLDDQPAVRLDLQRAREQVLAAAYARDELSAKTSTISKAEVDRYIHAHPDQFAQRQLFQIERISFAPQKDMHLISAAMKEFKTLDQVAAKLDEFGVQFSRGRGTLNSMAIPAEMLRVLRTRRPDDIFLTQSKATADFFKVISVDARPLASEDAAKFAVQRLTIDLAGRFTQQTVNAALAIVKYEGDYARVMATPTPSPNIQLPESGEEKPGEEAQPLKDKAAGPGEAPGKMRH